MARILTYLLTALLLSSAVAQNPLDRILRNRDLRPFDHDDRRRVAPATAYEVQATERGRGSLALRGPNQSLDRASVTLTREGRAEIRVSGRQRYRFGGTWRRGKANQALLTITQAYDRSPASATGSVTLRNGTFHKLYLKGESRALDGPLVLSFTSGAAAIPAREQFRIDQTRRGRGTLNTGHANNRISQARVLLQRDGDARLYVYGERGYRFDGAWSRRSHHVIDVRFKRGPNRSRVDLVGSVSLIPNQQGFARIDVNGDAPALGGRCRVNFIGSNREYIDRKNGYRGKVATIGGTGHIRIRGKNWRLSQGSVTLYHDGNAYITFRGKYAYTIEGTWFACQDPKELELEIEIDQLNKKPANAVGKLLIRRNGEVHGVEMQGHSDAARGPFNLTYHPASHAVEEEIHRGPSAHGGSGGDPPQHQGSLSADEVGAGRYQSHATEIQVNRARVQLRADGSAALTFTGRDTISFAGTWTVMRDGVAEVSLSRLQSRIPVTGKAIIQYHGDRATAVSITGTSRQRGPFDLTFRTETQHSDSDFRDHKDPRGERKPQWKTVRGIKDLLEDLF